MKCFFEDVDEELRDIAGVEKPVIVISQDKDNVTSFASKETSFKLGEEFEDDTKDGTHCKVRMN